MVDIYSAQLSDILPSSIKEDKKIKALASAISAELQSISAAMNQVLLLVMIDDLDSDTVDNLAYQLHVDFYDHTLSLEKRRELVKKSIQAHRYKGTPYAIEQIASVIFKNSTVSEWFDYEGEPHHFRVETEQLFFEYGELTRFNQLVESVKRKSSWFDGIVFKTKADGIKLLVQSKNFIVEYPVCNALVADDIQVPADGVPVFMATGQVIYVAS